METQDKTKIVEVMIEQITVDIALINSRFSVNECTGNGLELLFGSDGTPIAYFYDGMILCA